MRLDLFLKASRLIQRRTVAKQLCEAGRIRVNGTQAKASKDIDVGDELEIRRGSRVTVVFVKSLPAGKQVSRNTAVDLFETIRDEVQDSSPLA